MSESEPHTCRHHYNGSEIPCVCTATRLWCSVTTAAMSTSSGMLSSSLSLSLRIRRRSRHSVHPKSHHSGLFDAYKCHSSLMCNRQSTMAIARRTSCLSPAAYSLLVLASARMPALPKLHGWNTSREHTQQQIVPRAAMQATRHTQLNAGYEAHRSSHAQGSERNTHRRKLQSSGRRATVALMSAPPGRS